MFWLIKKAAESFSVKIFTVFALINCVIAIFFIAVFVRYQTSALTDNMVERGKLLVTMFAYNSRIGVFTENVDFL
ncbi:MAG: hybrid sensor histidine kinase/response regulator, partial [Spirochaetota bacterium]